MQKQGIEKIQTIGDAYLAVCGLPDEAAYYAKCITNAALKIQAFMNTNHGKFQIRIHTGPVVAGIVGVKKYACDIWGDTVNIAARMEQNSEAGKVNISGSTYELVKEKFTSSVRQGGHLLQEEKGSGKFIFTHRGKIQAKNKGEVDMYFVDGIS